MVVLIGLNETLHFFLAVVGLSGGSPTNLSGGKSNTFFRGKAHIEFNLHLSPYMGGVLDQFTEESCIFWDGQERRGKLPLLLCCRWENEGDGTLKNRPRGKWFDLQQCTENGENCISAFGSSQLLTIYCNLLDFHLQISLWLCSHLLFLWQQDEKKWLPNTSSKSSDLSLLLLCPVLLKA